MTPRILRLSEREVGLIRLQVQKAVVLVAEDQAAEGDILEILCVGDANAPDVLRRVTHVEPFPGFLVVSLEPLTSADRYHYLNRRAQTRATWAEAATVSPFASEGE